MAIADRKLHLIRSILNQPLYLPSSGMYEKMEQQLQKCSLDFLQSLDTLIGLKQPTHTPYDAIQEELVRRETVTLRTYGGVGIEEACWQNCPTFPVGMSEQDQERVVALVSAINSLIEEVEKVTDKYTPRPN